MGYGSFSADAYATLGAVRAVKTGVKAFSHTDAISKGKAKSAVHDRLNPHGVTVRESRDSVEHPASNAIAVLFDVTGSMGGIPRVLQEKLPKLMGLLMAKGYVTDPQVLFGAVGDATCDDAPLQVGQFESNVEMDEDIDKIYVEGGGGGQMTESYELGMYFMARHTALDCLEKRGKKGYLFLIGDEYYYPAVKKSEVKSVVGVDLQDNIPITDIVKELQEKYEVFHILPVSASYGRRNKQKWVDLFGQNVLELDNPELVCELIVTTIGIAEGYLDSAGEIATDLGVGGAGIRSLDTALAAYTGGGRKLAKASVKGKLVGAGISDDKVDRL